MGYRGINPDNTVFVILSFEGPDAYSLAGGLGVRVEGLTNALAAAGFPVHLIFIGDPRLTGEEQRLNRRLILHRWCQWISQYYPRGVYEGENEKLHDFNDSVPWFIAEHIVRPAVEQDKLVVILGEEWHTAEAMCRISDLLHGQGMRERAVMFWNANNTFGFERINWGRLAYTTTITTVSRYMKHAMWKMGVNPLVIPNGIPAYLLNRVDDDLAARLRESITAGVLLSKVARYHPDKRWNMAIEATGRLKAKGQKSVLLARGGIEPHGCEVMDRARSIGLKVKETDTSGHSSIEDYFDAIAGSDDADVLNIRFHCTQDFLRIVYRASDAVLANSGHEPFGLVGLETMAAGGIAFTGATGEDYAVHLQNSVVLETADPQEIEAYVDYLVSHPDEDARIRGMARNTAEQFTWGRIIENLIQKLEYQAQSQGILASLQRGTTVTDTQPASEGFVFPRMMEEREPVLAANI